MEGSSMKLGQPLIVNSRRGIFSGQFVAIFSLTALVLIGTALFFRQGEGDESGQLMNALATGMSVMPPKTRVNHPMPPLAASNFPRAGNSVVAVQARSPLLNSDAFLQRGEAMDKRRGIVAYAQTPSADASVSARVMAVLSAPLDLLMKFVKTMQSIVKAITTLLDLRATYKEAISKSPAVTDADKEASHVIGQLAQRIAYQYQDPYTFPSRHERILEPYDYYCLGQRFTGNLINFDKSYVGNAQRITEMQEAIKRGENVLLFANHQSEADPAVWALLTEQLSPSLATDIYYIAGDRVVLDTAAKPFSMGRNLVCVHSKRHMDDDPSLRAAKMATNAKSVRELGKMFKAGGAIVWVAPSGGRDRKNDNDEYEPSAFDSAAVVLLHRMMTSSKKPGHVYPMAMASAEIMPPPRGVEKKLGEKRVLDYHPVGISIGEELNEKEITAGLDKAEKGEVFSKAVFDKVKGLYGPLADVIYGKTPAGADYSQPWKK
eukprot:gnl/TRDRNA2_/TRDRNA2_45044_c0_seq1.p1 gnl/TRDRNA2_/TRDRNA2_45044_c0~~gnl/TRDRNA2_/TRDRNA2_45044_c0_seq1.p1  ORF type:complete len:490 (+),score=85.69 gnl/TRDRNA2_/TRDRNA2_45044_c0_seq1:64-1533(+)